MPFQSTVLSEMAAGIPGELFLEGPLRAQPVRLNTTDAANNVFGRALTIVSGATGTPTAGSGANPAPIVATAGGAGVFAGILANPKEHVSYGTPAGGPFADNFALPNGTIASAVIETPGIFITVPAACNPGDSVFYTTAGSTPGSLVTAAPGAATPAGSAGPIGKIERFVNAGAGLAVASILQPARPAA